MNVDHTHLVYCIQGRLESQTNTPRCSETACPSGRTCESTAKYLKATQHFLHTDATRSRLSSRPTPSLGDLLAINRTASADPLAPRLAYPAAWRSGELFHAESPISTSGSGGKVAELAILLSNPLTTSDWVQFCNTGRWPGGHWARVVNNPCTTHTSNLLLLCGRGCICYCFPLHVCNMLPAST